MIGQIVEGLNKDDFSRYLSGLTSAIPGWVYIMLVSSFLMGAIIFVIWKGIKKGMLLTAWLFLIEYISLLVCSTVVFRQFSERKSLELRLFWSYERAMHDEKYLIFENIMNIVVFVPFGGVLCCLMPLSKWWVAIITGVCMSVLIELMQLGFHRGLCELDDVIHNTAGCILGVLFAFLIKGVVKYPKRTYIQRQQSIYV